MEPYSTPRATKQIGDLFTKYKTLLKAPQSTVEKECVSVIKEVTGFVVENKSVIYTVSTRTVSLQIPSMLKTELKFKQKEILSILENRLGKENCPKTIL